MLKSSRTVPKNPEAKEAWLQQVRDDLDRVFQAIQNMPTTRTSEITAKAGEPIAVGSQVVGVIPLDTSVTLDKLEKGRATFSFTGDKKRFKIMIIGG